MTGAGNVVETVQQERITRHRHDGNGALRVVLAPTTDGDVAERGTAAADHAFHFEVGIGNNGGRSRQSRIARQFGQFAGVGCRRDT